MYSKEQFAKMIDNTLLRPDCLKDDVLRFCDESVERHFATVCILPCWFGTASRALLGSDVKVCTVIAFPFGATTRLSKIFEIKNAIANGAREVDAVMNISHFKSGDYAYVADDLRGMADAARGSVVDEWRRVLLKVIIETAYLTDNEKEEASCLVRDSGADFIKTSTGTASSGASAEDIRRIRRAVGANAIGIKASGGIKTVETALQMLDAGANRIGTSSGSALYDAYTPTDYE